ncbi:MAG: hypothetical protein V2A66_07105 [Pseudomonadota bacterium]
MGQRMTWEEMKTVYPDEWLLIIDCEENGAGQLLSGVVARHSMDDQEVFHPPALDKDCTFKYTGECQFPGGWRAHADHNHF